MKNSTKILYIADQFAFKAQRLLQISAELNPVFKDLLFRDNSDKCIESHNGLREFFE